MIRVLFIIRQLGNGGAERQLLELARAMDKSRFAVTVATFYDGGPLWDEMAALEEVRVISLKKQGRWDLLSFTGRWLRLVNEVKPHIIHGYLPGGNIYATVAALRAGARSVWGIRNSNMDLSLYGVLDTVVFYAEAIASRGADLIIANSEAGRLHHSRRGYSSDRMIVIPNGIDTSRFFPEQSEGLRLRREWGCADDAFLIGIAARFDYMKDHPTFLRAAAIAAKDRPDLRFVCIGDGPESYKRQLKELSIEVGLRSRVLWKPLSSREMPAAYNALDLLASASAYGEGFSNSVAEAMACGKVCVVTDVGDSAALIADRRCTVASRSPAEMASSWMRVIAMNREERAAMGMVNRNRIMTLYSTAHLARTTEGFLEGLVKPGATAQDESVNREIR